MSVLVVAVALVGLLGLLNLLLLVGVLRRLREMTEQGWDTTEGPRVADVVPQPGKQPAEFTVSTVDGREFTRDDLTDQTLIGFFTPGCEACQGVAVEFADAARKHFAPERVIAAIDTTGDDGAEYREVLAPVAQVVVGPRGEHPLAKAYGVGGFPVVLLVGPGGEVVASGFTLGALPVAVG